MDSMDEFPIEVIEQVVRHLPGYALSSAGRVSRRWHNAVLNVQRTDDHFWRRRCEREIDSTVLDTINPYTHLCLDQLDARQCRNIYIRWYRFQRRPPLDDFTCLESDHKFGSDVQYVDNITTIAVTGTLVITGHRSGEVKLTDVYNNMAPIVSAKHMEPINDIAVVNLISNDKYEIHKLKPNNSMDKSGYPTAHESYTNHHHMITVSSDQRIFVSLIAARGVGRPFEVCPILERNFLKVRVCRDLFAVSEKCLGDIGLFRMSLRSEGVVPIKQSLNVEFLKTISVRHLFNSTLDWFGFFTFSNLKLKCLNHKESVICGSNVGTNLLSVNDINHEWQWNLWNELEFLFDPNVHNVDDVYDYDDMVGIKIKNVFCFGDGLFFVITTRNQILFSTDSKVFTICPLDQWLKPSDYITCISLFGSVLVCASNDGYLFAHRCPKPQHLHYITHHKPLINTRITTKRIISLALIDNGLALMIAVATNSRLYVVDCPHKWTALQMSSISSLEVTDDVPNSSKITDTEVIEFITANTMQ